MALTFDTSKCVGYNAETATDDERLIAQSVIFTTMFIGMHEITQENWEKFYRRTHIWERNFGSQMCTWEGETKLPVYLTPADIYKFIGLHTNANGYSDAYFKKKIIEELERDANGKIRKFWKEQEIAKAG